MSEEKELKPWVDFFESMLEDFRLRFPEDKRSDREIVESYLDELAKDGTVREDEQGCYVLPRLKVDERPLPWKRATRH